MRPSFFSPNKNRPRKLDSRKKENAFHRQRLPNDAAGSSRKRRPVGAKLKFHRDSSDDTDGKINCEDAGPESSGAIVVFVTGAKEFGLKINQEQGEAHGQLRKNVMKGYGECEMEPMHR